MNNYELILLIAFIIYAIAIMIANLLNIKSINMSPVYFLTNYTYASMYSKYRLFIRESFKDSITCWTNKLSLIFLAIGISKLVYEKRAFLLSLIERSVRLLKHLIKNKIRWKN